MRLNIQLLEREIRKIGVVWERNARRKGKEKKNNLLEIYHGFISYKLNIVRKTLTTQF